MIDVFVDDEKREKDSLSPAAWKVCKSVGKTKGALRNVKYSTAGKRGSDERRKVDTKGKKDPPKDAQRRPHG